MRPRPEPTREVLHVGDLSLDAGRYEVFRGGKEIRLTPTEFHLLRYFMRHHGHVLSRAQIIEDVWHEGFRGDRTVVDRYVSYLRRKLHAAGPPIIRTVRHAGYVLDTADQ